MGFSSFLSILNQLFRTDSGIYSVFFILSVHINKYVLSVLGFTYPTVYQGWQTFVSVLLLLVLRTKLYNRESDQPLRIRSICRHIPEYVVHLMCIVTASKALAAIPVVMYLSVQNIPTLCCLILTMNHVPVTEFLIGILGLLSSLVLLVYSDLTVSQEGKFWMIWYCVAAMISEVYFQCDDYHKEVSKLYRKNVFCVIMLAPGSFYVGEAFAALEFRPRERFTFYWSCAASGALCILLQLFSAQLRRKQSLCRTMAFSRIPAVLFSVIVFPSDRMAMPLWYMAIVNMASTSILSIMVSQSPSTAHSECDPGKDLELGSISSPPVAPSTQTEDNVPLINSQLTNQNSFVV